MCVSMCFVKLPGNDASRIRLYQLASDRLRRPPSAAAFGGRRGRPPWAAALAAACSSRLRRPQSATAFGGCLRRPPSAEAYGGRPRRTPTAAVSCGFLTTSWGGRMTRLEMVTTRTTGNKNKNHKKTAIFWSPALLFYLTDSTDLASRKQPLFFILSISLALIHFCCSHGTLPGAPRNSEGLPDAPRSSQSASQPATSQPAVSQPAS